MENFDYPKSHLEARRLLIKFLAGSPLFYGGLASCLPREGELEVPPDLIASPKDALNVFDFQKLAKHNLPPAHYGYIATGVRDDITLHNNEKVFRAIKIRMRRLLDNARVDMSTELFGKKWNTPIIICPCGSQKAFHPEGEIAVAKAARAREHLQILSTVTTSSIEDVAAAREGPVWYQLYPSKNWVNF